MVNNRLIYDDIDDYRVVDHVYKAIILEREGVDSKEAERLLLQAVHYDNDGTFVAVGPLFYGPTYFDGHMAYGRIFVKT